MPDIVAGLIGIGFLILWIYCIYDVITTDEAIVKHLPKVLWLIIVVLIPDIGSLLWLGIGRPRIWDKQAHDPGRYGSPRGRSTAVDRESGPAPSLDDEALADMDPIVRHREEQSRLRLWEEQLKRREEELRRRELGGDPSG
jgi:hypothetical protein